MARKRTTLREDVDAVLPQLQQIQIGSQTEQLCVAIRLVADATDALRKKTTRLERQIREAKAKASEVDSRTRGFIKLGTGLAPQRHPRPPHGFRDNS